MLNALSLRALPKKCDFVRIFWTFALLRANKNFPPFCANIPMPLRHQSNFLYTHPPTWVCPGLHCSRYLDLGWSRNTFIMSQTVLLLCNQMQCGMVSILFHDIRKRNNINDIKNWIYLLLTELEVRTVSYGTHRTGRENEVSKICIISLKLNRRGKGDSLIFFNIAGRTVEYGPQNWPIIARVLTESYRSKFSSFTSRDLSKNHLEFIAKNAFKNLTSLHVL